MSGVERRGLPGLAFPEELLKREAHALAERYNGVFSAETVERYVLESYTSLLRVSAVRAHVATRAVRFAADRLVALAQASGAVERTVPEVLFVCVQNAGRSQMAAALLDRIGAGRVHVRSAGSMPVHELDPAVVAVMTEQGFDLSQEFPKPLTDDVVQAADVVITMGCGDACPLYPGKRYLDWDLADPAGEPVDVVRGIRDDIAERVQRLLDELVPTS